jgi:LytS/YehU family sensor histidine kinase
MHVQNGMDSFISKFRITFINAIFFFGYAYITIFLLVPEFLLTKKIVWFILLFALIGVALSALKLVVSNHIFYSTIAPENIERYGLMELRFIVVNTKDMTFIVALFCVAKYVKDYLYAESIRKKLEIQNKAAQAKLIQSQFDPHFLFNTINNMYALSLLNPLKTKEVIHRIKIVLRYIIEEIQKDFVDLKDELLLVENYIQLEKLRYGKRLKIEYNFEDKSEHLKVPPMVLFFLVENCFKHGSSLDAGTPWIKIGVNTKDKRIFLTTENSKPQGIVKNSEKEKNKYDLKDLRKRLGIIYNNEGFNLKIDNLEKSFKVQLELKEEIEARHLKYR